MRFQQIKELLHYLEQVHYQLGLCYGRMASQVDSERSRMLLVYLQGREDAASAHLHEYASSAGGVGAGDLAEPEFQRGYAACHHPVRDTGLGPDSGYRHSGVPLGRAVGG